MVLTGRCYCGQVRYEASGEPSMRAQCLCRECRYIAGGGPNFFMAMPADGFVYVEGAPSSFTRPDLERAVTREFCPTCGTHLATRLGSRAVAIKVGSLDDPALFEGPQMSIWTDQAEAYHHIPEDVPAFPKFPTRG